MSYRQSPFPIAIGGTGASTQGGAQTSLGVPASTSVMLLNGTQAMAASLQMGGFTITGGATPVNPTDVAIKSYVDNLAAGIRTVGVRVKTTGASYTLSGGTPNTLDGVSLAVNDLILVNDQSTQSQNGIYSVTTVGTGTNGTWARATGWTTSANYALSVQAFVDLGTTNGGTVWILAIDPDSPPTLGTTALVFSESGSGTILAGNGLTKSGNTISAEAANSTITISGSGIAVNATYPGNTSLVTLGTVTTGVWNGTTIAVLNGGTGATGASGARSNLSAAPNTPSYWLGATNGELSAGVIPSVGAGLTLTVTTGVFGIDTTVVATATNTITLTNKTLTSPIINGGEIARSVKYETGAYTVLAADDIIKFTISSGANATLPASSGVAVGKVYTIKNAKGSTANLGLVTSGSDTGENSEFTSSVALTLYPGDSMDVFWDGSTPEWTII